MTIRDKMRSAGQTSGFDYLRIILAVAVLVWHSTWYSGSVELNNAILASRFSFVGTAILPLFFALSGFLVSGSLQRTRLHQFITLRIIRLIPALTVEVTLSALILGLVFTKLPIPKYISSSEFHVYFLNVVGIIHFTLPGVFENNPGGPFINAQLWTVPVELECYLSLIVLSICTLTRRRLLLLALTVLICLGLTVWPIASITQSRQLVLCFLAAVVLYLYRDVIPYSNVLGAIATILTPVLLITPADEYLVPFPAAYAVIWLGLMRPPSIPFGDLSYGVYLFHLPVEQTIMHLFPVVRSWWLLTLISLPIVLGIAWLSWNLVEEPILRRKKPILAAVDLVWSAVMSKLGFFMRRRESACFERQDEKAERAA
jgi:peptidoglycan/LPS O-acetylase OafA/YrhL